MASRVTRSFHSVRRPIDSLSLFSSFRRKLSSASSSPIPHSPIFLRTTQLRRYTGCSSNIVEGSAIKVKGQAYSLASFNPRFTSHLSESRRLFQASHSFYRSFASTPTSKTSRQKQKEGNKDISTMEDPFDSPTYHIPEKPVSYTEGAAYSFVIFAGLGIAAVAGYGVFKELIFEPKEYKIFSKALEKIQHDGQVRVRIGSPIKGYGQESRNRAARQRIPHRVWTDEDGVEHVEVNFHIRGSNGDGKVYCEMFKDKTDNQWKYMYLIVDVLHPSPKKLILESFLPA